MRNKRKGFIVTTICILITILVVSLLYTHYSTTKTKTLDTENPITINHYTKCEVYLKHISIDLYEMEKAIQELNYVSLDTFYDEFQKDSYMAIKNCKEVSEETSSNIINLVKAMDAYYLGSNN